MEMPNPRRTAQRLKGGVELGAKPFRGIRTILGNVSEDLAEIRLCLGCDDE